MLSACWFQNEAIALALVSPPGWFGLGDTWAETVLMQAGFVLMVTLP